MDFQTLLQGMDCSCGKHHRCDIGFVAVERDAVRHLSEICNGCRRVLLVADENTFAAAGEQTVRYLSAVLLDRVIFSGETVLIPNEEAVERVKQALNGHDMIVGIGSGVIQDLCKYVAFFAALPYCIVATAPSMDGYASDGAAMITDGMKVTYKAKVPTAILADTAVLKEAPLEMIQAGYGDIVGKYSALNDWELSRTVNGEYFCQTVYDMTMEAVQQVLRLSEGLLCRDEESVKALTEALILVGIAMSFAGSSRPASGSEHHLSHFFEITGILNGKPYFPHGIDVAYSTVVTARLRERLLKLPNFLPKSNRCEDEYEAQMKRVYGPIAEGCMELQRKTGFYDRSRLNTYAEKEVEIREILGRMPSAETIEDLLGKVGLSMAEFYDLYGEDTVADAVAYAKDLKDRYTVLWMYHDLPGSEGACV